MDDEEDSKRRALFEELAETGSIDIRNQLVERHAPLAAYFANRYRRGGGDDEDLGQVAHLALVKAVDRFDPSYGVQFSTFAGRTIDGELKRYLRDQTWAVKVPRSLLETAVELRSLSDRLTTETGRAPTVAELVEHSGYDNDLVLQALDVGAARMASSIDQEVRDPTPGDDPSGTPIAALLGEEDENLDRTEAELSMRRLLETLDDRRREIVELRFFGGLTQQQIADRVGVSQMQVSRLLRQSLEDLRARLSR